MRTICNLACFLGLLPSSQSASSDLENDDQGIPKLKSQPSPHSFTLLLEHWLKLSNTEVLKFKSDEDQLEASLSFCPQAFNNFLA